MYSTTEYYKQAVQKSNPSYLTGTITFKDGTVRELNDGNIALGGVSIEMQAVSQDVLTVGSAILGQLDISIKTNANESRYKYFDAKIDLDFNIETASEIETVPLGEWTVTEADRVRTTLKLVGYDNMFKMDKDFQQQLVGTPFDIMKILAKDCEVELAEDEFYYKKLPNGDATLTLTNTSACHTYRQAASAVAEMCGAFVQADRYGKISMRQFRTTPNGSISKAQRYSTVLADYVCKYEELVVNSLAGTFVSTSTINDDGVTLEIEDAPAWDEGTEAILQMKADRLMSYIEQIQYTPGDLSIISDPSIDCGDLLTVETDTGEANTLVTSYTWNYHKPMELRSVGKNPYLRDSNTEIKRVIRDIQQNGSGNTTTALYSFTNYNKFIGFNALTTLASVVFVSTRDTFVLFNGTFQLDVDVDDVIRTTTLTVLNNDGTSKEYDVPYPVSGKTTVTIQYYLNYVALGEPYNITLEAGSHLITLHYPITVYGESINRLEVKVSADNGVATVESMGFTGTISGQGLANKPRWDGTITAEDIVSNEVYTIKPIYSVGEAESSVIIDEINPDEFSTFTERFGTYSVKPVRALGFTEEMYSLGNVTNYAVDTSKKSRYVFNREYIAADDNFRLNTSYVYKSMESNIDSGNMCSVVIRTDDKVGIEGVVITDE